MPRPVKALLLGYYGYGNAGDEIVLSGIAEGIRSAARGRGCEIRALSGHPEHTRQTHGLTSYPRFSPYGILRAIRWADVLVLGGGSLIQDATSHRSAAYYLWIARAALAMKKKLFLWAQGFGPLEDVGLRRSAARTLTRASAITLRDTLSLRELQAIGVPEEKLILSADPAFLLQPADELRPEMWDGRLVVAGGVLGIAMRSWPSLERTAGEIAAACGDFVKQSGLSAFYIPFQQPHDAEISAYVCQESRQPGSVLMARPDPAEMVGLFGKLSMALGMRLHSLILSARSAVPFAGLSYDPKIERFCQAAGMPCLTADQIHSGELLDILISLHANRDCAAEHLRSFAREQTELARTSARAFWEHSVHP